MFIPSLNLNKSPKECKNGSMIFAKNIKLSSNGDFITNEEGFKYVGSEIKGRIIEIIPCETEYVVLSREIGTIDNNSHIYRCKEDVNGNVTTTEINTAWKYNGGDITGTYTYNVNGELIIAIAEYVKGKNIPLRIINLDRDSFTSINSYNIASDTPVCNFNLIGRVNGGSIPNGIYQFFIRYELDKDSYTSWHPIGIPQYAIDIKYKTLVSHNYETAITKCNAQYNQPENDCAYNLTFKIEFNKTYEYKSFQIGYILQHDNATLAREWKKFNFDVSEIIFDAKNVKETTVDALTESTFNLYNVRSITNYDNRLYVGNFDETDYNPDLQRYADNIKVKMIRKKVYTKSATIPSTKTEYKYTFTKGSVSYDYKVSSSKAPTLIKLTNDNNLCNIIAKFIDSSVTVYDIKHGVFTDVLISGILVGHIAYCESLYVDLSKSTLTFCVDTGEALPMDITHFYQYEQRKSYSFKPTDVKVAYNSYSSTTTYSKFTNITSRTLMSNEVYSFYVHFVREDGTYTNGYKLKNTILPTNQLNTIVKTDGSNGDMTSKLSELSTLKINNGKFLGATIPSIDCSGLNSIDELKDKRVYEIMGCNLYKNISDFSYYENNNGDMLFKTDSPSDSFFIHNGTSCNRYGVGFTNIKIPNDYIGCFFTYEEPEHINNYQAIVEESNVNGKNKLRASDVETGAINYNGTICIPVFKVDSEATVMPNFTYPISYINNININSSNYPSDESSDEINTVGVNGGIYADLYVNKDTKVNLNKGVICDIISFNRNIYTNKVKRLISLGPVAYIDFGESNNTVFSYADTVDTFATSDEMNSVFANNKAANMEFNYPSFFCTDRYFDYNRPVYIGDDGKVYDISANNVISKTKTTSTDAYATSKSFVRFSNINLDCISLKKEPEILVGVFGDSTTSTESHQRSINRVIRPINATDLIEFKGTYIERLSKIYTNFQDNYKFNGHKRSTIRRSDVIADESTINNWKKFRSNQYKVINNNKGEITNLFGLGDYFYIHTEHSLYVIDRTSLLKTEDLNVQVTTPDILDINPKEVFTSSKGYGGLQYNKAFTINEHGYFFIDTDGRKFYNLDNNQLTDLTDNVKNLFNYKYFDWNYCNLVTDSKNDRVLISIRKDKSTYLTLSYNYKFKSFISLHDYLITNGFNTKNNCYIQDGVDTKPGGSAIVDSNRDHFLYMIADTGNNYGYYSGLSKKLYNSYPVFSRNIDSHTVYDACIDVIFNEDYDKPKVINSLNYISARCGSLYNDNDERLAEPSEYNNNISGIETIRIYSDSCDTKDINVYQENANNINDTYKLPYYDKGVWNFNYFRDLLHDKASMKDSDNTSLMYGRFFVVRFIFRNDTVSKFRFEDVNVFTNIY